MFPIKRFQTMSSINLTQRQKPDKRKELRHTLTLPVKVAGADCHSRPWNEVTETLNVSSGGVALHLTRRVMIGDIVFLELALPSRLQKNRQPSPIYKTYALVRYVELRRGGKQIVRLQFLQRFNDRH